jgi:hypothetical protein
VRGVVKDKRREDGATRVSVDVWCENQHGEKTAVGTATGLERPGLEETPGLEEK